MSQSNSQASHADDTRMGLNFLFVVARVWAISLEMFLHRDMGIRFPGGLGACVLLFVPLYGCFWEGHNLVPLFRFLIAYVAMCFLHRISAVRQSICGRSSGHSYYNGTPIVCRLFKNLPEDQAKQRVEPVLVISSGLLCLVWNQPLGCYLIGGAIALLMSEGVAGMVKRQRVLDMHDAIIEQQLLAEQFRKQRGDRW